MNKKEIHPDSVGRDPFFDPVGTSYCDRTALDEVSMTFPEERAAEIVGALLPRLASQTHPSAREAIINALGETGGPRTIAALTERSQDTEEDAGVRRAAARALKRIGVKGAWFCPE